MNPPTPRVNRRQDPCRICALTDGLIEGPDGETEVCDHGRQAQTIAAVIRRDRAIAARTNKGGDH